MTKSILVVLIFLLSLISCQTEKKNEDNTVKDQQSIEDLNKSIVNKWLTEVNKENFEELFNELWADNCIQFFNSSSHAVEIEDFRQMIHQLYTEYPVITHEVHDIIACEDKVVAKFSAKVLHDTIMFGVPASDKEIEWNAIAIFQISNGKIQTRWEVTDLLGMYEQLGMELKLQGQANIDN